VLLQELGRQLDDGRVYDRHLPELATALSAVLEAYSRRPHVRNQGVGRSLTGVTSLQPGGLEVTSLVKRTVRFTGPR
jgi:hypothetical protein